MPVSASVSIELLAIRKNMMPEYRRLIVAIEIEDIKAIQDLMSSYGAEVSGGISRLLYTESWLEMQETLKQRFADLGMQTDFDAVGNLKGTFYGSDSRHESDQSPRQDPEHIQAVVGPGDTSAVGSGDAFAKQTVATGSHVDTVVNGGKLDGQLGIFGGYLAIADLLHTYGQPKKNLAIFSIAEEEGSRFPTVFWGSKNLFNIQDEEEVSKIFDKDGVSFIDAMHNCGFDFSRTPHHSLMDDVCAFVELHIEQGNTLEKEHKSIGVITDIVGQKRYNITLKGEANHAGTTLMRYRQDVVQVFASIVKESLERACKVGDPLVLTFGKIEITPNTVNVVPGDALFTMDCRHTNKDILEGFTQDIEDLMRHIAAQFNVDITIDCWMDESPVPMDAAMVKVIEGACNEQGINYRLLHSGAGHDSQIIANYIPTGMIFVPSIKGISHNPAEDTALEDIKRGIELLQRTLYELAY
jgi:allantoate deiminase